jgi:broad specificity phosphatase PhoE
MKLIVDVSWDDEASVWYAVSRGQTGLATESESLDGLRERILAVLPDLLDLPPDKIDVELVVHGISAASGPIAAE